MKSGGLMLAAALMLVGCALGTPYPLYTSLEVAKSFGYSEQQLSNTRYRVTYAAPVRRTYAYGRTEREQEAEQQLALAYDMALWRAAELALAKRYPAFEVSDRDNNVQVDIRNDYYYHHPFFHHGHHHHFFPHHFHGYYDRYAELAARVTIAVHFRETPGENRFDAEATLKRLQTKYPDAAAPVATKG